jgi:hypothetical protein
VGHIKIYLPLRRDNDRAQTRHTSVRGAHKTSPDTPKEEAAVPYSRLKIRPVEAVLTNADGRTDGNDEANSVCAPVYVSPVNIWKIFSVRIA